MSRSGELVVLAVALTLVACGPSRRGGRGGEGEGEGPAEGEGEGPAEGEGEGEGPVDPGSLQLDPEGAILFEGVEIGEFATRQLVVRNGGPGPLTVRNMALALGSSGEFSVGLAADSPSAALPATLQPRIEDRLVIAVLYEPVEDGTGTAELVLYTDDPERREARVQLLGPAAGDACLAAEPRVVAFGDVPLGMDVVRTVELHSCGDVPLLVEEVELVSDSAEYSVLEVPPGLGDGCLEGPGAPCAGRVAIPPGGVEEIRVRYEPDGEGYDQGNLVVVSSAVESPESRIELHGHGREQAPLPCRAEARPEGERDWRTYGDPGRALLVDALSTIELRADGVEEGDIIRWTVAEAPEGSASGFDPDDGSARPTFLLDLAGLYTFELELVDPGAPASCRVHVEALPERALVLELVWHTPADPDEHDEGFAAGSDADLHLLRPQAEWFCSPGDCFYANPDPEWGEVDVRADNPSVDRDDTDGAGPERIGLAQPTPGVYRIAAHLFNDHGYGPSDLTVRIFIDEEMVFERTRQRFNTDNFWEVATVTWPEREVQLVDRFSASRPESACR